MYMKKKKKPMMRLNKLTDVCGLDEGQHSPAAYAHPPLGGPATVQVRSFRWPSNSSSPSVRTSDRKIGA